MARRRNTIATDSNRVKVFTPRINAGELRIQTLNDCNPNRVARKVGLPSEAFAQDDYSSDNVSLGTFVSPEMGPNREYLDILDEVGPQQTITIKKEG